MWPLGQAVKTWPSQGQIMGSIPVGVTIRQRVERNNLFYFIFYRKVIKKFIMEEENKKALISILFKNVLILTIMIFYVFLVSIFCIKLNAEMQIKTTKILSMIVLFVSIFIFEIAYHKDNGKIALLGIEIFIISFYTLIIWTITKKYNFTYKNYLLYGTLSIILYYILKESIMHTKEKKKYLNNLSDIHEILGNEPLKKEAKKRNIEE